MQNRLRVHHVLAFAVLALAGRLLAQAPPGGFAETFALAADRRAALERLIPGTEERYYYECLLLQHEGRLDEVSAVVSQWTSRHGRGPRVLEVEARQALLGYERDSKATMAWLRRELQLSFDQQADVPGTAPQLPSRLELPSEAAWLQTALARASGSVDALNEQGLRLLAAGEVADGLLRPLLRRLQDPSAPNFVALIARELGLRDSGGFGSLPAHDALLLPQLLELNRQAPRARLLESRAFVDACLLRLRPPADVDVERDEAGRLAFLERLWAFVEPLPAVHNGAKAHVLYHRLRHDLESGRVDEGRLESYLRLPRRWGYVRPELLQQFREADLVAPGYQCDTGLPAVRDDEDLVRACLEQVFAGADAFDRWSPYVRKEWLQRVFAEAKILRGEGDMERWYSMLGDPGYYERLQQRVELRFPPTMPRRCRAQDEVVVELDVKNVPTLLCKLYRIDAQAYLRQVGKEVDASIPLDGVEPNEEQVFRYAEPPLRRVRRQFRFESMRGPGVYVVEFVGNGVASRAVIQKGRIELLERVGAAGHVFTAIDEDGAVLPDAVAFCAGSEFRADERGEIVVPFSTDPGRKALVVTRGPVSTLHFFAHKRESMALELAAYVERETLQPGGKRRLIVRPQLRIGGAGASLSLLEEATLEVTARLADGGAIVQEAPVTGLGGGAEFVHEFEAPARLARLEVALRGKCKALGTGRTEALRAAAAPMEWSGFAATEAIAQPLLLRSGDEWRLEARGRNGEPIAGQRIELHAFHAAFVTPFSATLQSDADGKIELGRLAGVSVLQAQPDGPTRESGRWAWSLAEARNWPAMVHGLVGESLRIPAFGSRTAADAGAAALFELRGNKRALDATANVRLEDGVYVLSGLAGGDYRLELPLDGVAIDVRVADGKPQAGWAVGKSRALRLLGRTPLRIRSLSAGDDEIRIAVHNATESTRVHVFGTRHVPGFAPGRLAVSEPEALSWSDFGGMPNHYAADRQLADELRYVLERRYAQKRPGNMLQRPSLLLNPWALDQATDLSAIGGGGGGRYGGRGGSGGRAALAQAIDGGGGRGDSGSAYALLDFLGDVGTPSCNLRPDADGVVVVRRSDLGPGQMVMAIAIDGDELDVATAAAAAAPLAPRDLRLPRSLPEGRMLAEQQRAEFVLPGQEARIEGADGAKAKTIQTLAEAHALLQSMMQDESLQRFGFIARWPSLSDDEKRALYREHACHELHLFLWFKDRAFFDAVLRPYLANKAQPQFLDRWLLGDNVADFLEPAAFARLNLVERILLLHRFPARAQDRARYVAELGAMLPSDPQRKLRSFLALLRSDGLDADGGAVDKALAMQPAPEPAERAAAPRPSGGLAPFQRAGAPGAAGPATAGPGGPVAEKAGRARLEQQDAKKDEAVLHDAETEALELGVTASQEQDLLRRQAGKRLFRDVEPTRIYAEHDYWRTLPKDQEPDLIEASAFWRDLAAAPSLDGFLSPHLDEVAGSFTEAMFALAVLALPFDAEAPTVERDGTAVRMRPKTPTLLARSEILPAQEAPQAPPVLLEQSFFRLDDRFVQDGSRRRQKNVSGEFQVGIAYGSQIVLTNPTDAPRRISVLMQIPKGAMPLQGGEATRSAPLELGAFSTARLEFAFYFPGAGAFGHCPAQVAEEGAFVGAAKATPMQAVATLTQVDTSSWEHVSQFGDAQATLEHLRTHNLQQLDLSRIAWRLRDREFFAATVELLRQRLRYDDVVWSFGVLHDDRAVAREFLMRRGDLRARIGGPFRSPLLDCEPQQLGDYDHLEFEPLFLARAHRIGPWSKIEDAALAAKWSEFVALQSRRPQLRSRDWAEACVHLLAQGRWDEAEAAFAKAKPEELPSRLQHDYMAAWFAFLREDPAAARALALPHKDHPVLRWRLLFGAVLQQCDEIEGLAVAPSDRERREAAMEELAQQEPALDVRMAEGAVVITHRNLQQCEVRYRRLDVETAFSEGPFAQQGLAAVAWVEPIRVDAVELAAAEQQTTVALPAEFQTGNVDVEVRAGGLSRRTRSLAATMAVTAAEAYGMVQARGKDGAPLAKVYVKCYARTRDGKVRFHKDGYTDLRGRFDYVSLSGSKDARPGDEPERFALLALSETEGAVLLEVAPPLR